MIGSLLAGLAPDVPDGFDPGGTDPFGDPFASQPGIPGWFVFLFIVVAVISLLGAARRGARYARHGIDPTTMDVDVAAKILGDRPAATRPAPGSAPDAAGPTHLEPADPTAGTRTITERLAELDRLRLLGTITAEEHAAARANVLEDV